MSHWNNIQSKIWEYTDVKILSQKTRELGKSIVFTNGCFDLLHFGHIQYLAKAADQGDFLVIGLNSASSVKSLKGLSRPINDEKTRTFLLASLEFVGAVVIFDELTPEVVIQDIRPDILIKGGDYEEKNIVGADFVKSYGGKVTTIPFVEGYSSTLIEKKIRHG